MGLKAMKIISPNWRGLVLSLFAVLSVQSYGSEFDQLSKLIELEADSKKLPLIAITLVDDNGVVWSRGFGKDSGNSQLTVDDNTIWRIGSVSKLFTDIAVMQYVEKGILKLDEPVQTYLPDFKPRNPYSLPITLRMLMSHSSGLVREPPVGNYFDPTEPSLTETVKSLNNTTLVYAPGSKTQYSNAGIAVVGRVLEKVSGQPFAQLLKANLLNPLGMTHSAFAPEKALIEKLPKAYMWNYQGNRTPAPTFELGMVPAGSMYASMNDLARFMVALIKKGQGINGRILKEKTLDQMWKPQANAKSARNRSYGIGFSLGKLDDEFSVSHGGAIYGFATQLKVLPNSKVGVAISTNLDMANGAINRIADHALRVLLANKNNEGLPAYTVTRPVANELTQKLAGLYTNQDNVIEISRRFGDLYVERVAGKSLRLRSKGNQIVMDGLFGYSEDFDFSGDTVTVKGRRYVRIEDRQPAPVSKEWLPFIGEYGFDHNVLYISEKFGKLHALIEWGFEYPLIDLGGGKFRFPSYGLYPNEELVFERNNAGKVYNASLSGVDFARRSVGDIDGDVFQIKPVRPVSVLKREALAATPPQETRLKGEQDFKKADLVDITKYSNTIKLDIRYASENNFLGVPVYSSARAFMQRPAAEALSRISKRLETQGYGLLVHDAYRPWYVTKIFWDATPEQSKIFVADPSQGSRHNRGCAIDLTLYDLQTGKPIEMVGLYDEMTSRSYPHYPGGTSLQRWHRELLHNAMESGGFDVYEYEWWHFDFRGWQNYRILTDTFESLESDR